MTKDLTIRLLGRPQVTKDDQVGYQRIVRQYVVEGYRASKAGIDDPANPLFLPVGTADEEFTDHYLVNQKIAPKQGSVDSAYLTREFVEIRDTYVQESVATSNDVRRVRRTYVVLRAVHSLGYTADEFAKHPNNDASNEPWQYAPQTVSRSPDNVSYNLPTNSTLTKEPGAGENDDTKLYDLLGQRSDVNTGDWLKGSTQVSMSQPGVDVWSVEWVTHSAPYWSAGVKQGRSSSGIKPPKVVSFDKDGLRIVDFGTGGGGSSYNQIAQLNFFVVADALPSDFATYWGGQTNVTPSVMLDYRLVEYQGGRTFGKSSVISNAVFNYSTDSNLADLATAITGGYRFTGGYYNGNPPSTLPTFMNVRISDGGGTITWNHVYNASSNYANIAGVQVTPIFTSADGQDARKIWRVSMTYVG